VEALPSGRAEWSAIPAFGRNSDLGFLFGAVFVVARFADGYEPYRWRAFNVAAFSLKETPNGMEMPWRQLLTRWDLPGLAGGKLRLVAEAAYSQTRNEGYFGPGNASDPLAGLADPGEDPKRRFQFGLLEPRVRVNARLALGSSVDLWAGLFLRYLEPTLYQGSLLAEDAAGDGPSPTPLGTSPHGLPQLALGLSWDTRDHETAPSRGFFLQLGLRGAAGLPSSSGIRFGGASADLRAFQPLAGDSLVLAGRLLTDDLFGDLPFYELSRGGAFEQYDLPGGACGIRGVPSGRYRGRVRVVANLEVRAMPVRLTLGEHRFRMGGVVFADAGRLWNGYHEDPALDGRGLGLKLGLGGGPRIQWGESVMIRVDLAWSPDASAVYPHWPIAAYMLLDHAF
jgi:hypothetical protein